MDVWKAFRFLGVPTYSSKDTIEARYRELAMYLHPDRGGDARSMAQLNEARQVALAHVSRRLARQ